MASELSLAILTRNARKILNHGFISKDQKGKANNKCPILRRFNTVK